MGNMRWRHWQLVRALFAGLLVVLIVLNGLNGNWWGAAVAAGLTLSLGLDIRHELKRTH